MFIKLIKQNLKSYRLGIITLLSLTLLTAFFTLIMNLLNFGIMQQIFGGLFNLIIIATPIYIFTQTILMYDRKLYKKEGYLTHTLPFTSLKLFWGISLAFLIMVVFVIFEILILKLFVSPIISADSHGFIANWNGFVYNIRQATQFLSISPFMYIILSFVVFILYAFTFILPFFFAISLGNHPKFNAFKTITVSVITYILYYIVMAGIVALAFFFIPISVKYTQSTHQLSIVCEAVYKNFEQMIQTPNSGIYVGIAGYLLMPVISFILYLVTTYLLKKKLVLR